MRNKKTRKRAGGSPALSLEQFRGDLAIMPREMFIKEYGCTYKQYDRFVRQFGVDELLDFLYTVCSDIASGKINVQPDNLREQVLRQYKVRIIQLNLYKLDKNLICNLAFA